MQFLKNSIIIIVNVFDALIEKGYNPANYETTSISRGEARAGWTSAGGGTTSGGGSGGGESGASIRASVVACLIASLYGPRFFLL